MVVIIDFCRILSLSHGLALAFYCNKKFRFDRFARHCYIFTTATDWKILYCYLQAFSKKIGLDFAVPRHLVSGVPPFWLHYISTVFSQKLTVSEKIFQNDFGKNFVNIVPVHSFSLDSSPHRPAFADVQGHDACGGNGKYTPLSRGRPISGRPRLSNSVYYSSHRASISAPMRSMSCSSCSVRSRL